MKSIVSEKGQITIPKKIRTEMGLSRGAVLDITIVKGKIVATKKLLLQPGKNWRGKGKLPGGGSVDAYLKKIRQ